MKTTKTPRNSLCCKRSVRQVLATAFAVALFVATMISPVYATRIQDTDLYKGGMNLLQDLALVVTVAAPVIGALFAGYYLIRRGMADEQEKKQWNKQIYGAFLTGVGAGLISGLITVLISYFNPTTP